MQLVVTAAPHPGSTTGNGFKFIVCPLRWIRPARIDGSGMVLVNVMFCGQRKPS